MNPLLNRLFQDRSKSKTKRFSHQKQQNNRSADKALVPKITTKVRLDYLPEPYTDKKKSTVQRVYVGKLPSISLKTQQIKEAGISRPNFRNRKLSSSIRDMQPNFFSTQLGQNQMLTEHQVEQSVIKQPQKTKPFELSPRPEEQKQQSQQQLFQYLKIIENNEQLNEQFCYMNRKELPYSYYIVDYQDRNKSQYLTVSLRGITCYKQEEESEFYSIKKFSKELEQFKAVKKINFFRNYILMKVMMHWKEKMIRKKFNLKCRFIITHLFSQNLIVQSYLHFLHGLGYDYSGGNFFNFNISITRTLQQFREIGEQGCKDLIKSIKKFDSMIQKQLHSTLQTLITKFRADQRVTLGSADKTRQEEPYLPFDSKRRSMKYTQMAKLKEFEGSMYRLIKYTDMFRFNTKVALIRKCYENSIQQLKNLKKAFENKESIRFTNWICVDVNLLDKQQSGVIVVQPSLSSISDSIIHLKDVILKEIFKDHRLFCQKKDQMFCQNLQIQQDNQRPSKFQLKYYIFKNQEFQNLQITLVSSLRQIIDQIQSLIQKYNNALLRIYNKNIIKEKIEDYLDNSNILSYLTSYRQDYATINSFQQVVEFALAVIKIASLKDKIRKSAQDKYKIISNSVPNEVFKRCEQLQTEIRNLHSKFKENPSNVQQYISFFFNFQQSKHKISEIDAKLQKLLEFEDIVYSHGIRIGQSAKIEINQCQKLFKELEKRAQQIESNQENDRKKFQNMVEEMIPFIEEKAEDMLKQIRNDTVINNSTSDLKRASAKISNIYESFEKIKAKKQQLFRYQNALKLGHKHLQMFEKLQLSVHYMKQIWEARSQYFKVQELIKVTGYGHVNELSLDPLLEFVNNSQSYSMVLQCYELLQDFKQQITSILKIIKLSQLVSSQTLQHQHLHDIKKILKSLNHQINIDLMFSKEGRSKVTCSQLFTNTNASQIQHQISQIVFLSAQESIVKNQLLQIEEYWKKSKIKLISQDIAQNDLPIMHLDSNEDIQEKLGYYLVMLKNIQGSPLFVGISRDRASINAKICNYMREFLWKWAEVEKQWIKLLPLMTNCPAVKHQSNVFFDFTSVDHSIRKLIRQVGDMSSLRRICDDYIEHRYIKTLHDCQEQLKQINVTFNQFLENKRSTYGRFYFLSDYELINILEHVKDARTASKFVSLCFNCNQLQLDSELMAGFQHQKEVFKLRKTILKGQTDQIFKSIQQNMKNSMKLNIKTLFPKLKITPNIEQQMQEYPLQIILVCDRIFWTEMSQTYLNTISYNEYKLLFNNVCNNLAELLKMVEKQQWFRLTLRYVQMLSLRQISLQLVRDQITASDFKWKEQIRMYLNEEQIIVSQFDGKLIYNCQYYPPADISISTVNTTRFLYEIFYSCVSNKALVINGEQGQGKRHLIEQAGSYFGAYQKEIICNNRLSQHFIMKLALGALSSGAWLSFYEFNSLNYSVCAQLLFLINKANSAEYRSQQYLFMLIHHNVQCQQISIYSFNHFAVYEPDKQKICQYLLEVHRFRNYDKIASKLMKFMKLVKPYLSKVMGSELELVKKVIMRAGQKRLEIETSTNQNLLVADAITQQIIKKERQGKSQALSKALSSFFDVEYKVVQLQDKYHQKLQTLSSMLLEKKSNIIVLGARSCKTTLIRQSVSQINRSALFLYGETTDNFFNSETIDYLRLVPKDNIIVYDSNWAISEWVDLITSGYLFIDGKRLILENQVIMEFRDINKGSPSFIGRCQILYLGQNIVTKWDKFNSIFSKDSSNYRQISEFVQQLFGKHLQSISEMNLLILANLLKSFKETLLVKNIQRIIVWILSVIDKQSIWTRQYGGRYSDFTILGSQLISIDPGRFEGVPNANYDRYLITPTKQFVLLLDVVNLLQQLNVSIHLQGAPQSGKTSFLGMLSKKYELSSKKYPHDWSEYIKAKYTYVRKEGKNILVDLQKEGHKIIVDDLDLGTSHHFQYLRVLIQSSTFRDKYFKEYLIEKFKLLTSSRSHEKVDKFWSYICVLPIKQLSKESLETIFQVNLNKQIIQYNMNKQVQQLIQGSITKAILIAHDDLGNMFGVNSAGSLLLGLLRNLLSIPKRQAYISPSNYYSLFKTMCLFKLNEKSINKRSQWQIKSVYENFFKVIFNEKDLDESEKFIYSQGQFRPVPIKEIKQRIEQLYPHIICFDKLVNNVIYLINQFRCMDNRIIMLGRKSTGKRLILEICSKISGIPLAHDISTAIISAIKNQKIILHDSLEKEQTYYEDLYSCQTDKDLEKLVSMEMKEQFRTRAAGQESSENKMLQKCKKMIMIALTGNGAALQRFTSSVREGLNMPVCFVEEWPPQALLNIYSAGDSFANMHAQIFILANKHLSNNNLPTLSLKFFEKYLKLYTEIYNKQSMEIQKKIKLHQSIHFRFNQSAEMVSAWQARVDILKKEIQETIKKSKETIIVNQLYSFALSIFYKQIKGEEEKYSTQTEQLSKLTAEIEKKIKLMEKVLKKIEKIVSSFQRTQLGELKKIYKQSKLIYFGVQCLCILLGEENTEERSINRILADPNLLMKMKAPEILTQRNHKLQNKFNKQYHSIQNQMRQTNNDLAKTLIEWIRNIIEYWETKHQLQLQQTKHQSIKKSLQKSSKKHSELLDQANKTKHLMDQKISIAQQHQKIKEEKEVQYHSINGRLTNAKKIIPILRHEQLQTKEIIDQLKRYKDHLRGNTILTAFTAVYLPLQPLNIKHKLLDMTKNILRKSVITFSTNFMAEISGGKIESLQSLNYYLLNISTLSKLVIDPHRKFMNYLEVNAPQETRDGVLEYKEDIIDYEQGKIYHSTGSIRQNKENLLMIDWQGLALQEKDAIFLNLAEFKRPEYFQAKNELEVQINRNIQKVGKMKQQLYQTICERQIKIIDDENFVENGTELQKLEQQTKKLKNMAEQKINEIEELTTSINEEVSKIISIFEIIKHFRKIDLQVMLNICRQKGNTIQNFIRWALSNLKVHHRETFLISLIVAFKNIKDIDILKDIVNQTPLKMVQAKLKKPQNVSIKNWETILKLTNYSKNFKKLMQSIIKNQIQFQKWCIEPISHHLPQQLGVKLEFTELWMLLYHIKPKVTPYLVNKMIFQELNYDLSPLPNKVIIETMNSKFPIIIQSKLEHIVKMAKQLNESRFSLARVSKIKGEADMKRIIWKSMQAKEWLICYDISDKKDIQMLEDICYYVMHYDKQPGFRIIIASDGLISHTETVLQQSLHSSTFLSSNSVHLYQQAQSCDCLLQDYPLQYQVSINKNHSTANKHIFNTLYKLVAICYSVLRQKYPQMRYLSFKKMSDILQFIKLKNITVQFNVFTIVQYLSKMASHIVTDPNRRQQIQELWEHIIDESKMGKQVIHGVHIEGDKLTRWVTGNHELIGCTHAYYVRRSEQNFDETLEALSKIFNLYPNREEMLALVRTQLGRVPIQISHKDFSNIYHYYYQQEIMSHNQRNSRAKKALEELNLASVHQPTDDDKLKPEFEKLYDILAIVSKAINVRLRIHSFKGELTNAINKLKKEHEFILYFNPCLPIVMVDPSSVYNLEMLISTYVIHQQHEKQIKNGDRWFPILQFTHYTHENELVIGQGLILSHLASQQFVYNREMNTIDPSYEVDGREKCPLLRIFLKENEVAKKDEDIIEVTLNHRSGRVELSLQYNAVFRQWGLREPKLILSQ